MGRSACNIAAAALLVLPCIVFGQLKPATRTTTTAPTQPARPPVARLRNLQYVAGQKVEVRTGRHWEQATVRRKQGEWTMVQYTPGTLKEWVEPWRIRKLGSSEDFEDFVSPNSRFFKDEAAPTAKPSAGPGAAAAADAPALRKPAAPASPATAAAPYNPAAPGPTQPIDYEKEPTFRKPDLADAARPLKLDPSAKASIPPDAAAPRPAPARITLKGATGEIFERVSEPVFPLSSSLVFVVSSLAEHGKPTRVRVEKIDTAGNRSVAVYPFEGDILLMSASPDGNTLLMRSNTSSMGTLDRVELWSLQSGTPTRTLIFYPYGEAHWSERDVNFATFVDNKHFLTVSSKGKLVLWEAALAKGVYSVEMSHWSKPALSATGKYLAVESKGRVFIVDALTGKALASFELESGSAGGTLAFSPSGKRLGALADQNIFLWDIGTGELLEQFRVPVKVDRTFGFTTDEHALLFNRYLVDLTRNIVLWKYETNDHSVGAVAPSGQFYAPSSERLGARSRQVVSTSLPDSAAANLAATLKPDDLLLLKPGMKVSLVVNIDAPEEKREAITKSLKERLIANALVAADNQPLVLVASTAAGPSVDRTYRRFDAGPGEAEQKVSVPTVVSKLEFQHEGKTVWESSTSSSAGYHLSLKEGESIQDAVNAAAKPNLSFFERARLPLKIAKPREPAWFGSSKL